MRIVKLALISAVVFFLLMTAMASLLPSTVIVSRPIDLTASPDSVRSYLSNLSHWKNWIEGMDTLPVKVQSANMVYLGETKVTITEQTKQKITSTWQLNNGRPMTGEFNFIVQEGAPHFTLQWQFTQQVKWYPWEKFASILSDKALGPFMEKSLINLEKLVEQQ